MTAEPSGHGDEAPHHPTVVPDVVGHPRHTGRFWFDFAAATAAIFISLVSLFVAISGESTQRELLAANSWPFLNASEFRSGNFEVNSELSASISITNDGVGPAKIRSFEVRYDGQPMRSLNMLLRRCCGLSADPTIGHAQLPYGYSAGDVGGNVVRATDARLLLSVKGPSSSPVLRALVQNLDRITFDACYCSILDRCWTSTLRGLNQRATPSCHPDGSTVWNAR